MVKALFGRRRPALWAALACAAGIAAAAHCASPSLAECGAAAATLFPLALLGQRWNSGSEANPIRCLLVTISCLGLLATLGAMRYRVVTVLLPPDHIARGAHYGKLCILRGRIADDPEIAGDRTRFALALSQIEVESVNTPASGIVLVSAKVVVEADHADSMAIAARLRQPSPARNPGAFDYRAFLAQRGIHGLASLRRAEQIQDIVSLPGGWLRERVLHPIRESIRAAIESNLSGARAGLILGMLLGQKYRITSEVKAQFRSTGLAHALVVSGLHVGLIALFFHVGLQLCRLPDRAAALSTVAILAIYALVTNLQPPVVRASIMAGVVLVGRAIDRQGDVYNSLGLAALIILLAWPSSLLSLSFQLSFAATLSIVGLHGVLARLFPRRWRGDESAIGKWVVAPLCVSLAAQLGTGPLIAYHFQQFAAISLVANLAVVPLLAVAVSMGIAASLTGWWLPLAATAFNGCNYAALSAMMWTVDVFSRVPFGSLTTPRPSLAGLLVAALLAFLLAHVGSGVAARKITVFVCLGALNLAVWSGVLRERTLDIFYLDVGQGDAAVVRFPNDRTFLIDGGNRSFRFDYGERVVLPFLRAHNVQALDAVVVSHPHQDHIGGLITVLEQFEVRHLVDGGQLYDSWAAGRLRELTRTRGVAYHRVTAGDSLAGLGGAGGLVLHPTAEFVTAEGASPHALNDGSVVIRFTYGSHRFLFTGDAEEAADAALLRWGERLRSDVLKVGHHGSDTSTHSGMLALVAPELSIIQVGEFNKFGHPAREILARLHARGTSVLRTDLRGAAMVSSDGGVLTWRTMIATAPE